MKARLSGFICYILVTLLFPAAKTSAQTNTNCLLIMTCPSNIVVTSCFNVQEFYTPTASNICCGVNSSVTCAPPSGSIFAVGTTTTVTCTATDCAQNTNFCTFTVTVLPGTNCATNCLQIQCPSNMVVTSCTNLQEFYAPTVTDTCCSNWTVVCSPASGSYFAPNTTNLIDCYVTDYCGMSNSCSFTLTVLQGTNCPTNCLLVQCPSNKTVQCGTQWSFDQPGATSCCTNEYGGSTGPGTNVLITPISTVTNGVCPQPTTITQTWSITDLCGDSNTCSQTVTVIGCCTNTNCITLICPSNIVVTTCSNCVPVFYSATATNTCCFSNVVLNYSLPSGYCFPLGTTTVTVTAYDPDCASTPPTACSFTVTVNPGTNCCSGPGMGLQSIQWLQLPTNTTRLLPNPSGANAGGTWIITNLPGYGNVLVVQEAPTNVVVRCTNSDFGRIHAGGSFDNPPTSYGYFDFTETGFGPYTWGVLPGSVELGYGFPYAGTGNGNLPAYQVSFYFLNGQPNPGSLVFATIGLSKFTTSTLSQPFTFRTEYDLLYDPVNYPQGPSADTVLDGTYGPPLMPGVTGTVISSAYVINGGDDYNTGYAILQPTNYLQTATLPSGSGYDVNLNPYPSSITNPCPYLTVTVNHYIYDIFSMTVGYLCCTNCPTNCLQITGTTNKTVLCGSNWMFDPPTATSCCTNEFSTGPAGETNVLITAINTVTNGACPEPMQITRTWSIIDGCGESNTWSQTVTVLGCCSNCLSVTCPTNKTVACGTQWSFDMPTATTCCTNLIDSELGVTNVLITVVSTQTNGVCPQVAITQTWSIVDACGNSNSCSQVVTVTGCCTNSTNGCCGTNVGPRLIQWLQCPAANSTPLLADPSGTNASGMWIITNLPCYGNVLVTQTFPDNSPDEMYWFLNANLENVPAAYGNFADVEAGYGPYSWGTYGSVLDFYNGQTNGSYIHYNLNFYFLSNAPNPCTLYLGVIGLAANTTATVSQPVVFRAEYDLIANAPGGNGSASANTALNGVFGPSVAGATGTIVGSAYNTNGVGDPVNTGWAVLQPTYAVNTVSLPGGSGTDVNGNTYPAPGTYPCLTLTVSQQPGDGIGLTVGYVCCCTNCPTNCLEVECPTNKTVLCGTAWTFDAPTATTCCTNQFFIQTPTGDVLTNLSIVSTGVVTNGACPLVELTQTWLITDGCGNTATCSQTVTVTNCCNPPCLEVQCPSNKLVACDSGWTFDLPIVTSCCSNEFVSSTGAATNVMITLVSTMTNGSCPGQMITETWSITDACGDSTNCSQTVTVTNCCNPPCLEVICPTNKEVPCGTYWTFDLPIATSCCSNLFNKGTGLLTNVLITPVSTVTNGTCPTVTVTQTWSITDGCGDSTNCSQVVTVTGCCSNNYTGACCGPNSGPQTIQWLALPSAPANALASDPSGSNSNGTWVIANLPCYGRVLITQNTLPNVEAGYFINPAFGNAPNGNGLFEFTEFGYGPYAWGAVSGYVDLYYNVQYQSNGVNAPLPPYEVNFYFLDGQPDICSLDLAVIGLGQLTTNTVSQPVTFRTEFDLTNGATSAYTEFSGDYQGALVPGVTGTVVGSAYTATGGYGDWRNTGWAVFQPASTLQTGSLPGGSGAGYPAAGTYPYLTVTVNHQLGDGFGLTLGYICCTNCLQVACPTNKSVQCGSNWMFDAPTATSCCATNFPGTSTNVLITVTSTMTNGVCPQIITRNWAITDACGESNNCSQVVTVVDTTPPMINCPSNTVVVALNSNCQFVIPTVQVSATDNCTPVCSLVYSQSPTNGTIVSGTNAVVTVTVTDLCGNSNSCHVLVEGKPETGPVVTIPASIIVSNCVVPCLSNYLTATDNCCPQSSLTITQSVPCGDLIASGGETVTVTVTDCHGNVTTKTVHLVPTGSNTFLENLTNTGSKVSSYISITTAPNPNNLLADGIRAVPYTLPPSALTLCASIPGDYSGYPVAVAAPYVPWTLAPDPANPASGAVSKWIAPDAVSNYSCPCGTYTYSLPFTLPAGLVANTATISGRWAADNGAVQMLINSTVTGNVMLPTDSYGDLDGFAHWTYFTINSGFLSGANTLQFVVTNQPYSGIMQSSTGLRVEFTSAYAGCAPCAAPSIISITPAQSLQEGSLATFSVNAGGTQPLTYQWQFNGVNIAGANNPTLHVLAFTYSAAGLYSVIISNPCGVVTGKVRLTVTQPLPWPNGSWNVATLTNPLSATFGSNLVLTGSSYATNFALNAGTTDDFGLPGEGGQTVNVMDINPAAGATIGLPLIAEPGSYSDTNYTLIMDIYEPDTSLGTPSTLFQSIACCVSNLGSGGQDGVGLTLDASNYPHLTGTVGGTPFDAAAAMPLSVDAWHRIALAVDAGTGGIGGSATLYLDGETAIAYYPCLCCPLPVPILWTNTSVVTNSTQIIGSSTLLSAPTDPLSTNGEFYVSGIQFHAIAMTPQMIAGIGSPANGPAPMNETSVGAPPVLSAALTNGVINITWSGNAYALQETSAPGSGVWADSSVPFTETEGTAGGITTTAQVTPASSGPSKFYRLIFRP